MGKMPRLHVLCLGFLLAATGPISVPLYAQTPACPAVAPHDLSPEEKAYSDGQYDQAEHLYAQALAQQPKDAALVARLVQILLREDKAAQAAEQANSAVAANPSSAAALTAMAEVQLRQGQPWLATKSLDAALAADPCYAHAHLVRSRVLHIDSMYASERSELQKAYDIDVSDPDILMAWSRVMPAAQQVEGTAQALVSMKDLDAETRTKAETTIHSMMPLLHEDTQTCKVLPTVASASVPLLPSREDGKHIDGFRIEVKFPKGAAKLQLDTAASGLYISKALADQNGFERSLDAPVGTVQADVVQIGPLEFHDCMVGVSDIPFPGKADGFIGADILAPYLITIDSREQKLKLDPLPPQPAGVLPADRVKTPELADYEPIYHRRQYLLVPVTLNNKSRKLFALDTGMRMSTMDSRTAHEASDMKVDFTNSLATKSGPPAQVYRDHFNFQFADQSMERPTGSILASDPTVIDHNAGFDVAGMLGFDVLGQLIVHLDYRDGLVKFESPASTLTASKEKKSSPAGSESPECPSLGAAEIPRKQTLELKVLGTLDSNHLKPGKEIFAQVVRGIIYPGCTLDDNSIVYGHVTAASSSRNPDSAELGLVFDHGDCAGHPKKPLALHLIAFLPPVDEGPESLHEALPTEVAGGTRQLGGLVANMDADAGRLSDGGAPNTVHPGVVVGVPTMKLDPSGGPACSARFTSSTRSVQLGTGSELILFLSGPTP